MFKIISCIYVYFVDLTGDNKVESSNVNKVILVSGKHYYALNDYRESTENKNVAIIRVESLCPFPVHELLEEIEKYKHARRKTIDYLIHNQCNINQVKQHISYCHKNTIIPR